MESELEELKELSIAKIKVSYNRSIDLEATHTILWDKSEKSRKIKLLVLLILSFIAAISLIFTAFSNNFTEFRVYLLFADIIALFIMIIIIWDTIQVFTGRYGDHGHIVNAALQLRELSMSFLQYKLDNLDKQGYIDELKSLEINDRTLKDRSAKYTKKLSNKIMNVIDKKIEDLKRQGIKKYFMTQEEIESATEKLQKYTALRTWIKFD
ncbi:MAG: hypothetical protein ACFE94_02505 [Candidatus Hodarchaeota archaeon]